jgi:hypothetical protein
MSVWVNTNSHCQFPWTGAFALYVDELQLQLMRDRDIYDVIRDHCSCED